MNRELLTKALCEIDESFIAEASRPLTEEASGSPERIVPMKKKRIITLALVAALLLSLSISAYAMYNSIATPQAAEKLAQEQINTWRELGILNPDVVFDGAADQIVELAEEQGGTSWYGRLFPHSYDVRWYLTLAGKKYGCNLNIDTFAGKIQTATIYALADPDDVATGEISMDMGNGEEKTYYYYENFDDLFPPDLTVNDFCLALAEYWGFGGYRLADRGDPGYTEKYEALYGGVEGSTRMVDVPQNSSGNCFLLVYFDGDQEGTPIYIGLVQYPGYVGIDVGIRHPVG